MQEKATESLSRFFDKGRKQITSLKLTRTKTATKEAEVLFEALTNYKYLTELKLQNFKISRRGAELLGESINDNFVLKTLDL